MSIFHAISAVFRFEWQRTLTAPRIAWWALLTMFPPLLLGMIEIVYGVDPGARTMLSIVFTYVLCPGVVCMMGVFLWATPAISSELEGRSWVYLAVRPRGALAVLAGKYLVAVAWTLPAGLISATLCVLITFPPDMLHIMWIQWFLVILSCCSYASILILIGVLFPKRTMAFAIFYVLLFEVVLAAVPAIINSITVQSRLRSLGAHWIAWAEIVDPIAPEFNIVEFYRGENSVWWNFGLLFGLSLGAMLVAAAVLRWREFTTSAESDV